MFDGLGVLHLVDGSANVQATYAYDPYGGTTASGAAAAGNPFRFVSGHLDSTGLYKFGTRYYDTAYGRWTQRDALAGVISEPGTVNRYAYVGDNPDKHTDPDGDIAILPAVVAGIVIAGLVAPLIVGMASGSKCSKGNAKACKLMKDNHRYIDPYAQDDTGGPMTFPPPPGFPPFMPRLIMGGTP